jgi:cell wall-associated NlpC family hydrolase
VDRSALQPGDLVFFGSPIHHVTMYIGNGQMVESPRSGLTVRVVSMDRSDYVGAGRP